MAGIISRFSDETLQIGREAEIWSRDESKRVDDDDLGTFWEDETLDRRGDSNGYYALSFPTL